MPPCPSSTVSPNENGEIHMPWWEYAVAAILFAGLAGVVWRYGRPLSVPFFLIAGIFALFSVNAFFGILSA